MRPSPVTLSLALVATLMLAPPSVHAVEEGEAAPDFAARSLDGDGHVSLARYRGKVIYLDFWASWCGPCTKAIPAIEKLRKELPASDFQVVAVNLDREPERAREFLAAHGVGYPSASDPEGNVPAVFQLETMPTSYIIDRKGVVRHVHEGFREGDIEAIRGKLRELIGGGKVASER